MRRLIAWVSRACGVLLGNLPAHRSDRESAASLESGAHWAVGPTPDLAAVLRALPGLLAENGQIGLFNPDSIAEIERHLGVPRLAEPDFTPPALPPDFDGAVYFAATPESLASLADFAENHAEPEIAIHLVVVCGGHALLEWFDIPEAGPSLNSELPEEAVRFFAAALGCTYERRVGVGSVP